MVALFTSKGGRLHRIAGTIFFAAMLVMAAFALYLAVTIPDPVDVFIAYLVVTAWITVRRRGRPACPKPHATRDQSLVNVRNGSRLCKNSETIAAGGGEGCRSAQVRMAAISGPVPRIWITRLRL
jgi:hypothetical protein